MKKREIVYLIRDFYRIQEHRIALGGQVRELEKQGLDVEPFKGYHDSLHTMEQDMGERVANSIQKEELWNDYLKQVRGIGPIISAGLINLINIRKAKHVSSIWKYAGLDLGPDGKGRNRTKAHLVPKTYKDKKGKIRKTVGLSFNPLLKTLCWKIGKSFVLSNSPYKKIYDQRKLYEKANNPKMSKGQIHNRAVRVMVKRFFQDLYVEWKTMKGLKLSLPYAVDKLGHKLQVANPKATASQKPMRGERTK